MISIGVDWAKPSGDETAVVFIRTEDDGTYAILADLRGEAAEYVAQLKAENERLQEAIFGVDFSGKDRLYPIHFEWWAKAVEKEQGYNSELTALLRRLAALGGE